MQVTTQVKRLAALSALSLLAACGGQGGAADVKEDGTLSFKVAVTEADLTTVPVLAAVDALKKDGHDVEIVELAEPELAIEGLAKGEYAISAEATSPALNAIQQDAPIKIIADVVGNQWALYGKPGVTSCDDLDDRPFGIFSEGAVATAMAKEWVSGECGKGKEPKYLTIGDSGARTQALIAGEIDATPLEIADTVALEESGKFPKIVDFAEATPDMHPQTVYANSEFLTQHKDVSQDFVTALVEQHEKINTKDGYLAKLAKKYLPDEKDAELKEIAKRYVESGLFDAGALTEKNVQKTIDFFERAGVIEKGLTTKDAADLSFIKEAA
ncbi:ABC transporter substrate-binding protein [Stackebrandtia nassauensis]|uniref:ABC-type nitrate/sulfonate/bicarbonate transport systems periplasmic components-like protein n=1 Tax=Stackebrandtia nassauensis (strain DSM 44728 / CIP 108903 / NRRL B-16338 / NBRC 102104 / LLR-40K-21) TaxID=446470 RepID=D3PX14_STANL|nr:ABC transporter substrate-binding protein [Stackebrandtia nassauensis]ADD45238.1 ABC-type nitrate/sulfonate/bicarbonate transport systems periplasmic components-like protein [Stackebrandtia nassauensis DSM 44728]